MSSSVLAMGLPAGMDYVWILVVVLLLFGAKKLPELARGVGKSMGEFKKARNDFEDEIKRAEIEATSDTKEEDSSKDA